MGEFKPSSTEQTGEIQLVAQADLSGSGDMIILGEAIFSQGAATKNAIAVKSSGSVSSSAQVLAGYFSGSRHVGSTFMGTTSFTNTGVGIACSGSIQFGGGLQTSLANVTADGNGTSAPRLTGFWNEVTLASNNHDVTLPESPVIGQMLYLRNKHGSHSLDVHKDAGSSTVNGGASAAVAAGKVALVIYVASNDWRLTVLN